MNGIGTGIGAKFVLDAIKIKEISEAKREKWIEVREIDGKSVEFLMVRCSCCGQRYPRQRVIRLSREEMSEWQKIEDIQENYRNQANKLSGLILVAMLLGGVIAAVIMANATKSVFGVFAAAIPCIIGYKFLCRFDKQRQKKHGEAAKEKKIILARHGNISVDEVGIVSQWDKKYVVFLEEKI